jgi:hypothetical protein
MTNEIQLSGFNVHDPKFNELLQKTPGVNELVQQLAQQCYKSDLALFELTQSHICLQGEPVQPNTTLGELLTTVNRYVKQENVQPARVANLLFAKDNGLLAQSGKLSLPLYEFHYANGEVDSQNRNRLCTLGLLALIVAMTMHKMLGVPLDSAKEAVLNQRMHVIRLAYSLPRQGSFKNYLNGKMMTASQLQDILDGQATIHFNGSRAVQDDEKAAVTMSMRGVDVGSNESLINGFKLGKIGSPELFTYYSMNHLWSTEKGGYFLFTQSGCEPALYEKKLQKVVSDSITLVYRCLWSWETGFLPRNYTLRSALSGVVVDTIPPAPGGKTDNYKLPKIDASQFDPEYFEEVISSIWARKSADEWYALTGEEEVQRFDEELNLFELATQLFYLDNADDAIFARQLSIRKQEEGKTAKTRFPKVGNALLWLMNAIESNAEQTQTTEYSGLEQLLGMNLYVVRGEEEVVSTTTPARSGVDLTSLLNDFEFDFAQVDF